MDSQLMNYSETMRSTTEEPMRKLLVLIFKVLLGYCAVQQGIFEKVKIKDLR